MPQKSHQTGSCCSDRANTCDVEYFTVIIKWVENSILLLMIDQFVIEDSFQQEVDLKIGHSLNVYGRDVVLTDCDDFTRRFYRNEYGIEQLMPTVRPEEQRLPLNDAETASISDCFGVSKNPKSNHLVAELKVREHNMKKFLKQDNIKLRFRAQICSPICHSDREFIITFHMKDDTISVFEIGKPNVGSSVTF